MRGAFFGPSCADPGRDLHRPAAGTDVLHVCHGASDLFAPGFEKEDLSSSGRTGAYRRAFQQFH